MIFNLHLDGKITTKEPKKVARRIKFGIRAPHTHKLGGSKNRCKERKMVV